MIGAKPHPSALARDPCHKLVGLGEIIATEGDRQSLWPGIDLFDICPSAQLLQLDHREQVAHRFRQRPEPVDKLGDKAVRLGGDIHVGDPPIEGQPHRQVGDIFLGNTDFQPQIELRCPVHFRLFRFVAAACSLDSLAQHFLIELDANLTNMAGLLVTKQIAGAADIHVVGGKGETGTKGVQGLHHLEPAARLRCQHPVRIRRQIGIGALPPTPDTATKLVEL